MADTSWTLDRRKFLGRAEVRGLLGCAAARVERSEGPAGRVAVRDRFLLRLGLSTGVRVMEMADLQCGDLFLDGHNPSLLVRCGKGGKSRMVFFSRGFARVCGEFLAWKISQEEPVSKDSPVFYSGKTKMAVSVRTLQKAFKRCGRLAGLAEHYSIHCLRHTYACFLLKASGWNLRLVQKQLGHASISTTQVYADVMAPDIQCALEKFQPLIG